MAKLGKVVIIERRDQRKKSDKKLKLTIPTTRREAQKKEIDELAKKLVDLVVEWTFDIDLESARTQVLECISALSDDVTALIRNRMKCNVERVDTIEELQRYVYNLYLKTEKLSIARVVRTK